MLQCRDLKKGPRDKERKLKEAAQNFSEQRKPKQRHREQRESGCLFREQEEVGRFHRDWCKAQSRLDLRSRPEMLGSRAVMLLLLVLVLPPWAARGRAVPEGSGPSWARCQQLSQKLCTLAWSAHPAMGRVVSGSLWDKREASPSSPRLQWKTLWP